MTDMELTVYKFILDYIKENGFAPTYREIGKGVYLGSTASVSYHIQQLEMGGWIKVKPRQPRAIKVYGYEFVKVENSRNVKKKML